MPETIQPGSSQWIGRPVRRIEDAKLLTGQGRFTDDVALPGQAHAAFVRSPHAHARIARLDTAAARAAPGVIAVFTGEDVVAAGLGSLPYIAMHKRPDGAAELVDIEWEPLPAVARLDESARGDAPVVWPPAFTPEHGNIAAWYRMGDAAACDRAFAEAAHVVRLRIVNQRVVANPLEPRALAASFDAAGGRYTLYCPTQNVHTVRTQLAEGVFKITPERLRVVCTDLGGGFGARGYAYPEHAAVLFAAERTGRPVKWLADRSENFLAEVHGRDNLTEAELAIGADQRFLALRIRTLANVGAYVSNFGAAVPAMSGARAPTGMYAIPALDHGVRILFTHTAPVDAYCGAGRPEMGYLIERLVSRAARELKVDEAELRLKNMIPAEQMPYRNPAGHSYDCGDFARMLRGAMAASDWDRFEARRAAAQRRGMLYGRGLACYIEITGSARLTESVQLSVAASGEVTLVSGTQAIGQGIATGLAQAAAEQLGVEPESVRVIMGDSEIVKAGGGAGGSRGLQVGGSAAFLAARALVDKGRALAARELEAAESDLEYSGAQYRVAGTDHAIGLAELAGRQPGGRIAVEHTETVKGQTWPNGCQVAEVEVDPETGEVRCVRHSAVDDIGRVVNPLVAEGQIHGGVMQGLGQALMEQSVYDDSGQLLTGSFMDYAMPRADALPEMHTAFDESVPTAQNPLGAKGVGEAGCHGAVPAVVNAVLDALAARGVAELDMPLTPERVWRAANGGG